MIIGHHFASQSHLSVRALGLPVCACLGDSTDEPIVSDSDTPGADEADAEPRTRRIDATGAISRSWHIPHTAMAVTVLSSSLHSFRPIPSFSISS